MCRCQLKEGALNFQVQHFLENDSAATSGLFLNILSQKRQLDQSFGGGGDILNPFAGGGFVLYPSKPNTNMMNSVYAK